LKLIYICSPYRGDTESNAAKARGYCRFACRHEVVPIAPHLIYPQFLDDDIPEEREEGICLGMELLKRCDELWVNVKRFIMKSRISKPVETQALRQENFA
jgi:hypothetical protein